MDINKIRKEYLSKGLHRDGLEKDPFKQLELWIQEAIAEEIVEPNAMVLATATKKGIPSTRTVLLKGIENGALRFFTNYQSQKASEIEENPHVSLTFYWKELERQVSINGIATKLSESESIAYFATRPKETQIGAWCSPQGQVLNNREELLHSFHHYKEKFKEETIPKPPNWGGYKVIPELFLFWKGRKHRLHDRFLYTKKTGNQWLIKRIAP